MVFRTKARFSGTLAGYEKGLMEEKLKKDCLKMKF